MSREQGHALKKQMLFLSADQDDITIAGFMIQCGGGTEIPDLLNPERAPVLPDDRFRAHISGLVNGCGNLDINFL